MRLAPAPILPPRGHLDRNALDLIGPTRGGVEGHRFTIDRGVSKLLAAINRFHKGILSGHLMVRNTRTLCPNVLIRGFHALIRSRPRKVALLLGPASVRAGAGDAGGSTPLRETAIVAPPLRLRLVALADEIVPNREFSHLAASSVPSIYHPQRWWR